MSDPLIIAGQEFGSRLFLGTAGYPNRKIMLDAIEASGTAMVTASIRRISLAGDDESLIDLLGNRALASVDEALHHAAVAGAGYAGITVAVNVTLCPCVIVLLDDWIVMVVASNALTTTGADVEPR